MAKKTGTIRCGIGGWNYEPWRETFYPQGLPQRLELHHASRQLSAIEINSTFYRAPAPDTYRKWHDETPDDFVFSAKAPRYVTHRKHLAEAADSALRFIEGALHLQAKLGALVWQLPPTTRFDAADLGAFLTALPDEGDGRALRHVLEVRHDSFVCEEYVALAREHGVATVFTDSDKYPNLADLTADFVYARLMRSRAEVESGYPGAELDAWAERARAWAAGSQPDDLPRVASDAPVKKKSRDVFIYFISSAKERNPAAARGLIERL
ncbi:DUF72 domain-containing protein [Schlegelella sp. S2-27]|uniref:DUF72 domain-containing protein n=1 Tax=Caldimonas mangrovi TaxID=2944811 RepID=A0ABT0YR22_9BURK|nr:DUF72 domain-containing protein [Caldimonas mangrovi]MCM5680779.1 DUF72 domain-containing protein [Caldimonas mangrovi]